jgi:hypothetical protein
MMSAIRDDRWYAESGFGARTRHLRIVPRPREDGQISLALWTVHPRRYMRRRCDDCRGWRPWQRLYEAYPDADVVDHRWRLLCAHCLAARLSDLVAELKARATA